MTNDKKSAETLNSLIEASPLAIFDLDSEGRVKSIWNQAAEEIFGWTKDEVLGDFSLEPRSKQRRRRGSKRSGS